MPKTEWYRPSSSSSFSGFISSIQNNLSDSIDTYSTKIYNENHMPIKALNWNSIHPWASSDGENGIISFSLKQKPFYITHYQLQQRTEYNASFLSSWKFQGSNNNETWQTIDRRNSPTGFVSNGEVRIFNCKNGNFKYFRIFSESLICVTIKKIEIYGFYCNESSECNLNHLFRHSCSLNRNSHFSLFIIFLITLS